MNSANSSNESVAIIAVHGVGDQRENEIGREIVALLQQANSPEYSTFKEEMLELRVENHSSPQDQRSTEKSNPGFCDCRSPFMQDVKEKEARKEEKLPIDIAFTDYLVRHAEPQGDAARYSTIRHRGEHTDENGKKRVVDVYEMYWADQSRLSGNVMQILGKLYQLLFHLTSLGKKTIEHALLTQPEPKERAKLKPLKYSFAVIEFIIASFLPVLNLCFAAIVLPALWILCPQEFWQPALMILSALTIGGAVFYRLAFQGRGGYGAWGAVISFASALGALCSSYFLEIPQGLTFVLLYSITLLLLIAVTSLLAKRLAQHRERTEKHMLKTSPVITAIVIFCCSAVVASVFYLTNSTDKTNEIDLLIPTIIGLSERYVFLFGLIWLLLTCVALCSTIYIFCKFNRDDTMLRAVHTALIGYIVSASLFFIVTIIVWKMITGMLLASPILYYIEYRSQFLVDWFRVDSDVADFAREKIIALSAANSGIMFNIFFIVLVVAISLIVISLLSSILYELFPKRNKSEQQKSTRLGLWLDGGFSASKLAMWLMLISLFLLPIGILLPTEYVNLLKNYLPGFLLGDGLADSIGAILVGSITIFTLFRKNIFIGVQKALDIALDIDNWLKERPLKSNPRGLILLRYLALLRELQQQNYLRIVFVAHSQGTVITADLLRYLDAPCKKRWAEQGLEELQQVPRYLLTVGSPLRQLYSLRFPDLYDWVQNVSAHDIGVSAWINGYCSGDYVGRYLWKSESDPQRYAPNLGDFVEKLRVEGVRQQSEFCAGAGAHTHYFDQTFLPIGKVIDALVTSDPVLCSDRELINTGTASSSCL